MDIAPHGVMIKNIEKNYFELHRSEKSEYKI